MKTIIYQLLPRLWGNADTLSGTFSRIDAPSLRYIRDLGATHLWLTGLLRHATTLKSHGCKASHPQIVKGAAGSPYAITDYYDVNPYLADSPALRMTEFEEMVSRIHDAGLKLIIDFVPNHVSRDYGRLGSVAPEGVVPLGANDDTSVHWRPENDFFYYPGEPLVLPGSDKYEHSYEEMPAKATGNNYSPHPGINDWYETVKINYCDFHTATWDKMRDILSFWVSKGVDGFRCDMAELVPRSFLRWLIAEIKRIRPETLFVAEVYQKNLYDSYVHEVGFDLLYDKSGLYDSLRAIVEKNVNDPGSPVELWQSARMITGTWQYLGALQPRMLNFIENHDEQRVASDYFARSAEAGYPALAVSLLFNSNPFMLYAGQEMGERGMDNEPFSGVNGRTSIFDWWKVTSLLELWKAIHSSEGEPDTPVYKRYREILRLASQSPAFSDGRTYDLCYCNMTTPGFDPDRHFIFLRSDGSDTRLVAVNFSASPASFTPFIPTEALEYLGIAPLPPTLLSVPAFDFVIA